ncbi:TIGR02117 family protein [Taibaiella koreensis]|uniref:TIGR02117 family protein n=1 Tax=Taibaiella koreensis TaxID=1268548 RepID=UPI000E59B469|nr:TIGR02117 family protein [Taibaiella koreensis]
MKKFLIKTAKRLGYLLGSILLLLLLYAGGAWLCSRIPVNADARTQGPDDISIYIRTNGVHTDMVTPVCNEIMDWRPIARFQDTESKDTTFRYASFGWGDKGFYLQTPQWSDLKFSVAFKAAFHLSSSAMHVTFYHQMPTNDRCREIRISKAEYGKLVQYIRESFRYDSLNRTINIVTHNDGYGSDDAFYEATGAYDLFHTCNTWANNALKACDQRACLWTPLDKGIFYQYR